MKEILQLLLAVPLVLLGQVEDPFVAGLEEEEGAGQMSERPCGKE